MHTVLLFVALFAPAAPPEARVVESELSRAEIQKVFDRGPQRFIAGLQVDPHLVKGKFVGFRIAGFTADGPLVNSRSVLPGDVVLRVNREPLERPEQFMRAWEVAQKADRLEVLLLRGTERILYRWKYVD